MKIESYSFGRITVDNKTFTSDVIIYPDRVNSKWWRKEGHLLQLEDISGVIEERPDIMIIGTGYSGVMRVPEETISELSKKGIKVYTEKTIKAVKLYNESDKSKKVVAAFHLTC